MTTEPLKTLIASSLFLSACFVCTSVHAATIRYALVVGNDVGVDQTGRQPFLPLRHAEQEATRLKESLVSLSNFDASDERTKLLTGPTRRQVLAAVDLLARQKAEDEKAFGKIKSLFLFYFTGHGQKGQLLLRDGPLRAAELGAIFKSIGADFSVGVFDACFSGSLDVDALNAKGMAPAAGLNLFRELPEEVLTAEGNIWYVSSGSGQLSYEDATLGGVFTHFFIEGMTSARSDGPGITLDSVWQYARAHTVAYTAERRRAQVPEQYVAKLRSGAPVYFSFPLERTATLALSDTVEGRFLLTYAGGNLTEVFDKRKGAARRLSVFPGEADLQWIDDGNTLWKRRVQLTAGSVVTVGNPGAPTLRPAVGERSLTLTSKGAPGTRLEAVSIEPGLSALVGVAYGFEAVDELMLNARHEFFLPFRFDLRHFVISVNGAYGFDVRHFPAFGFRLHQAGGSVAGAYSADLKNLRVGFGVRCRIMHQWQRFDDGKPRTALQVRPAAEVSVLFPRSGRFLGEAFTRLGPLWAPGVGKNAPNVWYVAFTLGLTFYVRII